MEQHSKADENYYVEASKLLELAHRAYELFEISEATQKRESLSFLLQNCKMDGKKLIPSLKMPFDQILLANKTQNWLQSPPNILYKLFPREAMAKDSVTSIAGFTKNANSIYSSGG